MNHVKFGAYLIITYLIGQQLAYAANWPFLYAIVTLPGTFFHELMHYGAGLALGGHPYGFSVIPTWAPDGAMDSLGHVMVHPNWYNSASIGLAPFMLAPLTGLLLALATRTMNLIKIVLYLWGAAASWAACVPSPADFTIAAGYPQSWPLAVVLLGFSTWVTVRVVRMILRSVQ
jgi:hypothetical protein